MGVIDYESKKRKAGNTVLYSTLYVFIGIVLMTTVHLSSFWKFIFTVFIVYNMVNIVWHTLDYVNYKNLLKRKKEQDSFDRSYYEYKSKKQKSSYGDSYDQYDGYNYYTGQKKGSSYSNDYNQYGYSSHKKKFDEDWFEYYDRITKEKLEETERRRRKVEEEYRRLYEEYKRRANQQGSGRSSQGSGRSSTPSNNDKISKAFQLFKLSPNESNDKIKAKYRELAIKWHPDKWVTDTMENQKIAERNFQKLSAAYEIIKEYKNIK